MTAEPADHLQEAYFDLKTEFLLSPFTGERTSTCVERLLCSDWVVSGDRFARAGTLVFSRTIGVASIVSG